MWRNIGFILFIFLLPGIQVISFCLAVGGDPRALKIAIINKDLPANETCAWRSECAFSYLSCRFLHFLDNDTFIKVYYKDQDTAFQVARRGEVWGTIYFNPNYTKYLVARVTYGNYMDQLAMDRSQINIQLDMSNQQVAFAIQHKLQSAYYHFARDLMVACKVDPTFANTPLSFGDPVYGNSNPSFTEFMAPGIIITIIFFLAIALTGSSFINERQEGLLDRSWIAGVTAVEIVLAHVITQFLVMIGQVAITLVLMIFVFDVPCYGPVIWVIVLTLLQGTCGMSFGFLISAICDEERNAMQLSIGCFYPNLLLSGVLWPLEGMPLYLRHIAYILPQTYACEALRNILSRGWDITWQPVFIGLLVSSTWIFIMLLLSIVIVQFKANYN